MHLEPFRARLVGGVREFPLAATETGPISTTAGSRDELTGLTPASVVPEPIRHPRLVSGLLRGQCPRAVLGGAPSKRLVRMVLLYVRAPSVAWDRTTLSASGGRPGSRRGCGGGPACCLLGGPRLNVGETEWS